MTPLKNCSDSSGGIHTLSYDFSLNLEELVQHHSLDAIVIGAQDGFSPLGACKHFLQEELGVSPNELKDNADWIRNRETRVSLAAIPATRPESRLKGVVLAADEGSKSYQLFGRHKREKDFEEFFFRITYAAIDYASSRWNARRIGLSHLSASGHFRETIANSNMLAFTQVCQERASDAPDSMTFIGCCIEAEHLCGFDLEKMPHDHLLPVPWTTESRNGVEWIYLDDLPR